MERTRECKRKGNPILASSVPSISRHKRRKLCLTEPNLDLNLIRPSYAPRGSLLGQLKLTKATTTTTLTVGIFAAYWPSWAIAFLVKSVSLKWIIMTDNAMISMVRVSFLSILVYHLQGLQLENISSVDIMAFNGPMNCFPLPF